MMDDDMSIISIWFLPLTTFSTLREGFQVGYNFGTWTRKSQLFYFTESFRLSSTQQKCVGNNKNKTHGHLTLLCIKNHQNPFSSLRERVVWSCV